jgi:hypothetical protein
LTVDRSFTFAGINLFDSSSTSGYTTTTQQTDTLAVSKAASETLSLDGGGDGINHDRDLFILMLNPAILVESAGSRAHWNFGIDGPSILTLQVSAGELKNPALMPSPVAEEFSRRGFTSNDFGTILRQDPLATSSGPIDTGRYARTRWSVPYRAPGTAATCASTNCTCAAFTKFISNDLMTEHTTTVQSEYTTATTTHVDLLRLTDNASFTFTSSSSQSSTSSSSNSAQTTISCPSPAYAGSPLIDIYWDTVYNSFVFAPNSDPIVHEGRVLDANGHPIPHEEVTLAINGVAHYTVTDEYGRFQFAASATTNLRAATQNHIVIRNKKIPVNLNVPSTVRLDER